MSAGAGSIASVPSPPSVPPMEVAQLQPVRNPSALSACGYRLSSS